MSPTPSRDPTRMRRTGSTRNTQADRRSNRSRSPTRRTSQSDRSRRRSRSPGDGNTRAHNRARTPSQDKDEGEYEHEDEAEEVEPPEPVSRGVRQKTRVRARANVRVHAARNHVARRPRRRIGVPAEEGTSDDDDDEENSESGGPKAHLAKATDLTDMCVYQKAQGRGISRFVDGFRSFHDIVSVGQAYRSTGGMMDLSSYRKTLYCVYEKIISMNPELERMLDCVLDSREEYELINALHEGRKAARGEDVDTLKQHIGDWKHVIRWEPPYPRTERRLLGFHHPVSGMLLCPGDWDWSNEHIQYELREGYLVPGADDYPSFLYHPHQYNPDVPTENFLCGKVLVTAYRCLFLSPSGAEEVNQSTRPGKAQLARVNSVTLESIAYVATLLRFVLSDQEKFTEGQVEPVGKSWPYAQFFLKILASAEGMDEVRHEDLLTWWDQQIFPNVTMTAAPTRPRSIAAKMEDERQARLRAAREEEAIANEQVQQESQGEWEMPSEALDGQGNAAAEEGQLDETDVQMDA